MESKIFDKRSEKSLVRDKGKQMAKGPSMHSAFPIFQSIGSQMPTHKIGLNLLRERAEASSYEDDKVAKFRCHNDVFSLSFNELAKIPYLQILHANTKYFSEKPDENGIIVLNETSCDPHLLKNIIHYYIKIDRPRCLISDLPAHINTSKMFELLDYLCIPKPECSLHVLDKELKKTAMTRDEYGNKIEKADLSTARDACVKLCWCGHHLRIGAKDQSKLLNMVFFIMSNPHIFYFRLRQVTINWYLKHFHPTFQQRSVLLKQFNNYRNQYLLED